MSDLNQVPGLSIGHAQDVGAATGLTVILCPQGATGGVSRRGASISTRQMGALSPGHAVAQVHAVLFPGGSFEIADTLYRRSPPALSWKMKVSHGRRLTKPRSSKRRPSTSSPKGTSRLR